MNNCILMAEIIQEPQLRYTTDQMQITEMLVQFPGLRTEDSPATLKVVGWGNLAQDIQQKYHQGDRVILEGRLSMSTVERPEGFKEKRAEMTVQKVYPLAESFNIPASTATSAASPTPRTEVTVTPTPEKVASKASTVDVPQSEPEAPAPQPKPTQVPNYSLPAEDVDEIPF